MKMNNRYKKLKITFILVSLVTATRCQAVGLDYLVEANSLERIATGYRFTEGPVWHPDGHLLFTDTPPPALSISGHLMARCKSFAHPVGILTD